MLVRFDWSTFVAAFRCKEGVQCSWLMRARGEVSKGDIGCTKWLCVCPLKSQGSNRIVLIFFLAGGARDRASLALTKTLALVCEINPGRRIDVPAWRETYLMDKLFHFGVLQ